MILEAAAAEPVTESCARPPIRCTRSAPGHIDLAPRPSPTTSR